MDSFLSANFFPIFAIVAFVALVLFFEGAFLLWNSHKGAEAKKLAQRLKGISNKGAATADLVTVLKNRKLSQNAVLNSLLQNLPRVAQLDQYIVQSGLTWTVAQLLGRSLLCAFVVLIISKVAYVSVPLLLGMLLFASVLPLLYVQRARQKRLTKIGQQLPDALDLVGRALRAGHALPSALKMTGDETQEPIAGEFRVLSEEINFGTSMQQALMNLSLRVPSPDVRYFVVSVLIQRDTGGNLTELLESLSKLVRDRIKFFDRIRILTTEGRMSAWVLGVLPFVLAGVLNIFNPKFISVLWNDPVGIMLTNATLGLMGLGAIWLYKLTQIRV